MLSDTISQFLTLLAQGPVSSDAIQDIVDFEISLAQVCDTTLERLGFFGNSRNHLVSCIRHSVRSCLEFPKMIPACNCHYRSPSHHSYPSNCFFMSMNQHVFRVGFCFRFGKTLVVSQGRMCTTPFTQSSSSTPSGLTYVCSFPHIYVNFFIESFICIHLPAIIIFIEYSFNFQHDWLGVLQGIFGPLGVNFELSSSVSVVTPNYFRRLTDLVESTPAVYVYFNNNNNQSQI